MTTELEMKEALDGCFFVYNEAKQAVTCRKVPKNHIPNHKPKMLEEGTLAKTGYQWTPSEDELLIELRHKNLVWRDIGKYIGLSPSAVRFRYIELCRARGMAEHKVERKQTTCTLERQIMNMRRDCMSFAEIGEALGITRNRVAGIVQRVRRRVERMEMAA